MRKLLYPLACCCLALCGAPIDAQPPANQPAGTLPTDPQGRPLNLDFETGTLQDWRATGDAFAGQPVKGDTVHVRKPAMQSRHQGNFWIGGYELAGDPPRGTLSSVPFKVAEPYATFLAGGGRGDATRVELVLEENQKVIFHASGTEVEDMSPVVVDLRAYSGKQIFIRLVDDSSGGWGHLNFDDFRFHSSKPALPGPVGVDQFLHAGLSPQEAARAMTVPDGFTVTLFAGEPDVHQPIAQAIDDRGRLWIAEAYS
jgi:hypothetical protein